MISISQITIFSDTKHFIESYSRWKNKTILHFSKISEFIFSKLIFYSKINFVDQKINIYETFNIRRRKNWSQIEIRSFGLSRLFSENVL